MDYATYFPPATSSKVLAEKNKFNHIDLTKQQAWNRAMEHEQLSSWLRDGVIERRQFVPQLNGENDLGTHHSLDNNYEKNVQQGAARETVTSFIQGRGEIHKVNLTINDKVREESVELRSNTVTSLGKGERAVDTSFENKISKVDTDKLFNDLQSQTTKSQILEDPYLEVPTSKFLGTSSEIDLPTYLSEQLKNLESFVRGLAPNTNSHLELSKLIVEPNLNKMGNNPLQLPNLHSALDISLISGSDKDNESLQDETLMTVRSSNEVQEKNAQFLEYEKIRFHSEWHEDGVKIWLGVDHEEKQDVLRMVAEIRRWATIQNIPLAAIFCNGKPLMRIDVKNESLFDLRNSRKESTSYEQSNLLNDKHYLLNKYILG